MKYCSNCLFPETKPDLSFNDEGVCSACTAAELKDQGIDWEERAKQFHEIVDHYRLPKEKTGWDCIVPVSGGKDSTYQAYFMKEVCGLNPLCVCFETTMVTALGQANLDNLTKMGMDVIHFKKNNAAYKKMVIEGFKRLGDEMWPNHIGIFTIPVLMAVKFNIPLIIWGENPQKEYGGPSLDSVQSRILNRRWLEEFGGLLGNRIQDMVGVEGLTEKELSPYFYPSDEEINRVGVTGVFLGSYFFWDARKQLEIVKQYGFGVKEDGPIEGTYTNYENLDEKLVGLHDYLKYVKYGFGRATDHVGIDIRNKRMTRAEGLELVKAYDGKYPYYGVNNFVEYSGMSKEEIDAIIDSFTNPILFKQDENGKFLRDEAGNLVRTFEVK
ncbi:MAG: flagellin modification protein, PseA [Cytophagales bacterium CG12_big_fil_rev_8_21_14_0_65_40_12]|nr:MAG: flagellin modification protein, PseA [Cytophagales bacterium CG12_big_fil_rev_8_21_14_0_65_40_12]PIW02798.1 MAG: N-acetyl sugar amidotransferase [Cytophagales bacterium CG17_big_fil_post_rev_8_21_14_2_50_40_13]